MNWQSLLLDYSWINRFAKLKNNYNDPAKVCKIIDVGNIL